MNWGQYHKVGVAVCTPHRSAHDAVTVRWHRARNALHWGTNLAHVEFFADGLEVGAARSGVARRCLEHSPRPEFLFFLDDDVLPDTDAVTKLMNHLRWRPDYDVAAGVYCCKGSACPDPLVYAGDGAGPFWDWAVGDLLTSEAHGITATHMGLTLIRVSLFQRMLDAGVVNDEVDFFVTRNERSRVNGCVRSHQSTEDIDFYTKAREVGVKILVDTSVLAGHEDKQTGAVYGLSHDSPPVRRARWLTGDDKKGDGEGLKLALDLGAGGTRREWPGHRTYTLDVRPESKPDYCQDVRQLNLPDGHFDLVACMARGSLVVTRAGVKAIEDVAAGDEVWTHKGRWRRVTANRRYVPGALSRVVTAGHPRGFLVSLNHPVLARPFPNRRTGYSRGLYGKVISELGRAEFVEARHLTERHIAVGVIPTHVAHRELIDLAGILPLSEDAAAYAAALAARRNVKRAGDRTLAACHGRSRTQIRGWIYHDKAPFGYHVSEEMVVFHGTRGDVNLPRRVRVDGDLMRLVGYYLADGSLSRVGRPHVAFHFNATEREFADDVARIVFEKFGICPTGVRSPKAAKGINVRYAGRAMHDLLTGLVGPGGAHEKEIPSWALWERPELQRELVEGIVRGDGHVSASGRVSVCTVSERLAEGLRVVLLRCGEKPNVCKLDQERGPEGSAFRSCGWRYDVSWRPGRKTSHGGLVRDGIFASRVWKIDSLPNTDATPVYGLEVEEDESYFAGGVTQHNSSHHLEHIGRWDQERVWGEVFRVTKPGGRTEHVVPSLDWAARKVAEGEVDEHVLNVLYGAQEAHGYAREWNLHYFGYTKPVAEALARQAGFVDVTCEDWRDRPELGYNLVVRGRKPADGEAPAAPAQGEGRPAESPQEAPAEAAAPAPARNGRPRGRKAARGAGV